MKAILPLFLCVFLLSACSEKPKSNAHWGTPEHIATEFFHALYNDKDLEKAKNLSTEEFAALLDTYVTPRQVGRTLMNMSYDTVTIEVNRSGQNLRQQYDNNADITLIFSGERDGKKMDNLRTVSLVKQSGNWRVTTVKMDPFSSTATF
jgi:Tfp pilus assembly PilM family ATPase